jgi:hypothetical protein
VPATADPTGTYRTTVRNLMIRGSLRGLLASRHYDKLQLVTFCSH